MLALGSLAALAAAFAFLALGVDPVPGYFYLFAWYPTIVLLDALAHRADGRPLALANRSAMLSVWLWSAPVWLVFEAANFRLDNWYYVFVPPDRVFRWAGMLLSFATVLPALFLAERLLDAWGVGRNWRTKAFSLTPAGLGLIFALGMVQLVLSLAWPRVFFPYIWGAFWLMCEPYVYRRRPDLSLFADLERGDWGRTGRVLIGGAIVGVLWETFNFWSRPMWIYTVPGLDNLKLYEMPVLGFIGFPFFALEAWAMYHALCAAGVAIPLGDRALPRRGRTAVVALITIVLALAVMHRVDRYTISSYDPHLSAEEVANDPAARLAALRGLGRVHAEHLGRIGIHDVCELAKRDAEGTWQALQLMKDSDQVRPTPAEVRVWQQAAARECVRG